MIKINNSLSNHGNRETSYLWYNLESLRKRVWGLKYHKIFERSIISSLDIKNIEKIRYGP